MAISAIAVRASRASSSPDIASSRDRLEGYTKQLHDDYGVEIVPDIDTLLQKVDVVLLDGNRLEVGDKVLIIAGSPPGVVGTTNTLRIHRMGEATGQLAEAGPCKHLVGRGSVPV